VSNWPLPVLVSNWPLPVLVIDAFFPVSGFALAMSWSISHCFGFTSQFFSLPSCSIRNLIRNLITGFALNPLAFCPSSLKVIVVV